MHRIIVSDIFGKTPALQQMADVLAGDVEIVDPYNAEIMDFKSEADAYAYFSSEVGFDAYTEQFSQKLKAVIEPVTLVGFSVGAAAIWKISNRSELTDIVGAVGFYGSQIRHDTNIHPLFPMRLIFPSVEQHFSVAELMAGLSERENVQVQRVDFLHGFMNAHSPNYDARACNYFIQELCNVPSNQCFTSL